MSVYFAEVGPYVKIGFSRNPEQRVRRLFASTTRYSAPADAPLDLASRRLIRAIDGTKQTERAIHNALNDFRIGTEWFLNEPELRAWVDAVNTADEYKPLPRPAGPYEEPTPQPSPLAFVALERALQGLSP